MDKQKLITVAKARIAFYEDLLNNHIHEMYQEDVDRFLALLSKAYIQLRTLEKEIENDKDE